MKISLKVKMFAAFSSMVLFFIVIMWLLNNTLLEKYYLFNKKDSLTENYRTINNIYKGNADDIQLELEKIDNTGTIQIIILDKEFRLKYSTRPRFRAFGPRQRDNELLNLPDQIFASEFNKIMDGKVIIQEIKDKRLNTNFIYLLSKLNNGDFIFMNTPYAAIKESVYVVNQFFIFSGIATLFIATILILLITGRFTKPILILNRITKNMANLDFNERYRVKSQDEIGQLGMSVNSLSEQLQKSISELQLANQKLQEDITKERQIDEMRKEFIYSVSHELKTPISLIQGYAEGLKVNVNKAEEDKDFYCSIIIDESLKMNKLVRQLLDLAQLEAGVIELEKTDFKITQLIETVLRKNAILFNDKGIKVDVLIDENLMAFADYDRMEQILGNYINNALNHVDERKIVRVKVSSSKDRIKVSVFNSGLKIPEESIDKIWTSFYKVDKARTRSYGGTGLGLAIVRAIQDSEGNNCGVENLDDGVLFWFDMEKLPVNKK